MKNFQNKTKIVKVSQALRVLLFCGLLVWIFTFVSCCLPWIMVVPQMEHVYPIQWYVFAGCLLQPLLGLVANLNLLRFFGRLKDGFLFDAQTVGYLSATGKWWLVYWVYQALFF